MNVDLELNPGRVFDLGNKRKLTIGKPLAQGDLCILHHCTYEGGPHKAADNGKAKTAWERIMEDDSPVEDGIQAVLKVAIQVSDNDLVRSETETLLSLYPPDQVDEKFFRYLPKILMPEPFTVWGRQANIIPLVVGHFSFAEIIEAYPDGIDYRDLVWMFKRALIGLGFAHTRGFVHGSVIPPHILVHPVEHGAKILDWCYAVGTDSKQSIKSYSADYEDYLAPEISNRRFPTPATDIFMLAKCAVALLGGDVKTNEMPDTVPEEIRRLFLACLEKVPSSRPLDAWKLHDQFSALVKKVVGKSKYREFHMPAAIP